MMPDSGGLWRRHLPKRGGGVTGDRACQPGRRRQNCVRFRRRVGPQQLDRSQLAGDSSLGDAYAPPPKEACSAWEAAVPRVDRVFAIVGGNDRYVWAGRASTSVVSPIETGGDRTAIMRFDLESGI
jgi:hypothetical protein